LKVGQQDPVLPKAAAPASHLYQPVPKDHTPPTINGVPPVSTRYTYTLGKGDDSDGYATDHVALSKNDLHAIIELAAQNGQSIVVHQHNYHYHYHTDPVSAKALGIPVSTNSDSRTVTSAQPSRGYGSTAGNTSVPTPSQDLLDLEQFEVDEEDFHGLDGSFGFGMEDYHGIPFNPS
jgi:hypothetical protein